MSRRFLIWFWSGGGGGSAFAVDLARRLRLSFGNDAVTLSLRADDPAVQRALAEGLDVRAAQITSDRRRPLATAAALAQSGAVLAEHARDADVVIVPMNFATAAPLSATLKQPLVYCAHDPAPHPGDYARLWQRTTQALLLARATRVVALSHYAAGMLRKQGVPEGKLVVAPLSSVYEPQPPRAPQGGPTRLLFAGRMIAYKGVDLLADALPLLAQRQDWRLVVAGHGPALDAAAIARFDMPQVERVAPGWMDDAALAALIAESDLVLAPYRSATQSGIVSAALAAGKPCIATPVGALPEQIGQAGWIADAATPGAFAEALSAALSDPAGRAARAAMAHQIATEAWRQSYWDWLTRV